MPNTLDATIYTPEVINQGFAIMRANLAPLAAFTVSRSPTAIKPQSRHVVKFCTSAATPQEDASNFEQGDSTVNGVPVTVHCVSTSFHVSQQELSEGLRLEDLVALNATAHAEKLIDYPVALMTVGNFGAALTATTAATFSAVDLIPFRRAIGKSPIKNLVLHSDYYSTVSNHPLFVKPTLRDPAGATANREPYRPQPYGFDTIAENSRFDAADAGVMGFACAPSAIVVLTGEPVDVLERGPSKVPMTVERIGSFSLGFEVLMAVWFSVSTRTLWAGYFTMIGAAVGDATAGKIIKASS